MPVNHTTVASVPLYSGCVADAAFMRFINLQFGCCLRAAVTLHCWYHLVATSVSTEA